ncbi:filamentous hemagglutinin N-terminal domain-containing protein [Oscillatoria sp. FACHB-1406]|uniref:two-partner secretion domain-containing protein n=1 Tax=Oscillatoria sp. FACHB-1406 TaxID=2692846 RepID=UPI001684B75D|nr:S-layer family protein [Oscillatoria sp. FACHB-1406]
MKQTKVSFDGKCDRGVCTPPGLADLPPHALARSLTLAALILTAPIASPAQIVPDTTLPNNSIVIPSGPLQIVTGGTTAGSILYHSFSQFNLQTGETAAFSTTDAISNIITRITGGQASYLDGTLISPTSANLFFINPSGITFGPNAQLRMRGSFYASTADSILLSDGSRFSATTPNSPSLLTVNVPVGLQLGPNPGSIINRSVTPSLVVPGSIGGLEAFPGQTLALIGGDIRIESGSLTARGGNIQLASAANSIFQLNSTEQTLTQPRTIQLLQGATVETSGFGGGSVRLWGGDTLLSGSSRLISDTFGPLDGGGIDIQATKFTLENGSYLSSSTFLGTGNAGNVNIRADEVQLSGQFPFLVTGQLLSGTFNPFALNNGLYSLSIGSGAAGQISISARQLSLDNGANIMSTAILSGAGGDISLEISQLARLNNGSLLLTGTVGSGNAGDLNIRVPELQVFNGTSVSTTPGDTPGSTGRGGNLNVVADRIELRGLPVDAPVPNGFFTTTLGRGDAGDLNVKARELIVADGSQLSSASTGAGRSGNINVAADTVELSGISPDGRYTNGLFASTGLLTVPGQRAMGGAGDITVNARRVLVKDGAQISVATGNASSGGTLRINASESVEVRGVATGVTPDVERVSFGVIGDGIIPSAIESNTRSTGSAGNVEIRTGRFIVRDGAEVGVRAIQSGSAGNLEIEANSIVLESQGTLSASTNEGLGGDIRLNALDYILMRGNSQIVTNAKNADSGNIRIETGALVALENSDITANAQQGRGGQVRVTANGIFGTQFRLFLTPESDITATSDLGAQFSGVVDLQTLILNPTAGLEQLPDDVIDPANRVVSGCAAYANSRFVVTGRGGLPDNPIATLRGETLWRDLQDFSEPTREGASSMQSFSMSSVATVVEATDWVVNDRGNVELVAKRASEIPTGVAAQCSRNS